MTKSEAIQRTVRALHCYSHTGDIREPGMAVLTQLDHSPHGVLDTAEGGMNSWVFRCHDGRVLFLRGVINKQPQCVELRTAGRGGGRLLRQFFTGQDVILWERKGCPS